MITKDQTTTLQTLIEELLEKMTTTAASVKVAPSSPSAKQEAVDSVDVFLELEEPQILIGQGGQTLFELQRILRMICNKKLGKHFYVQLDINGYRSKKVAQIKSIAAATANEVAITGHMQKLPPMSSYERRLVHEELSKRPDVFGESEGVGAERRIVIKPRQ